MCIRGGVIVGNVYPDAWWVCPKCLHKKFFGHLRCGHLFLEKRCHNCNTVVKGILWNDGDMVLIKDEFEIVDGRMSWWYRFVRFFKFKEYLYVGKFYIGSILGRGDLL
jgi:hypothetical protein